MKNKLLLLTGLFFSFGVPIKINAQAPASRIYMPPDIRKVYENGTRTYEGLPGIKYWQNTCHYTIQAEMNPYSRELTGREWIEYTNNSSDSLNSLVLQLYQDVNKNGSLRSLPGIDETSGVILGTVIVAGDTIEEQDMFNGYTLLRINLKNPLKPGSSVKTEINWKVQMTNAHIREGFADSTSAFVGLWYPKMAVYDDVFGWNGMVYRYKEEFYSPLSSYDVSISLPKGFYVWATGELQNKNNYPAIVNERLNNLSPGGTTIPIIDSTMKTGTDEIGREPWKFQADSVPDFAFAFSDHYLWDAALLNTGSRIVQVNTAYPKAQYRNYRHINNAVKDAMAVYSLKDPGIPFPYPAFTSFYGLKDGGMEYPMMSFDCTFRDTLLDSYVTIHEMLHSYAPFYLRTNETLFAWMDEGMTVFYSIKMLAAMNYNRDTLISWNRQYLEPGIHGIGNLPLFTPSTSWNIDNLYGMMYLKPTQMLTALEDLVGAETWRKCFVEFFQTWKNKAPMPHDFIFFVNNYLNKDLYWFWDKWFMHFGYPDLGIQKADGKKVILENRGLLPIPFTIIFTDGKGQEKSIEYHADVWTDKNIIEIESGDFKFSTVEIMCNLVPDFVLKDNVFRVNGEW